MSGGELSCALRAGRVDTEHPVGRAVGCSLLPIAVGKLSP